MKLSLKFEDIIGAKAPELSAVLLTADIRHGLTPDNLWSEIEDATRDLAASTAIEQVNKIPAIAATRTAYKAFGKDPNRYRPSAEALTRRAIRGLELYRTLSVIDLINLVSLRTGHSIGAFDADRIDGDTLTLGVGREGEPYEAIGRGSLNIAGLPVWRDKTGGIGTPTSDNERTKLSDRTRRLAVIINCYAATPSADATARMTASLLEKYADATDIEVKTFRP